MKRYFQGNHRNLTTDWMLDDTKEFLLILLSMIMAFLKKIFLFVFTEWGWKRERGGEEHQCTRETSIGCLSCAPNQRPGP